MTAPPVPFFGGKTQLAHRIAALLPDHRHYVEPYAGGLAVLLAKRRTPMETVNDIDDELVTFWRVLRQQPEQLALVCALTPHSRGEFDACHARDDQPDDVERARRVFVQLTQGRGAVGVRSGWRHYIKPSGNTSLPDYLVGYVGRIAAAAERLQAVSLECRPALDIIDAYGRDPEVLLYVDPPYLGTARATGNDPRGGTRRYRHEMLGADQHAELLAALQACTAAVVLSGYPSEQYELALSGWDRITFATGTGQFARGERSARTEVLWSNRPLAGQPGLWEDDAEPDPETAP